MAHRRIHIRRPELRRARIEIIPMIDTIFFLLVFFMIASLTQVRMNGIAVSLPKASAAAAKPLPKVVVTVDKADDWYVGTERVAPDRMQLRLQAIIDAAPKTLLIVNVDQSLPIQSMVDVMDAVNGVKLPESAVSPDNRAPDVLVAPTPVDADGNAAARATPTRTP